MITIRLGIAGLLITGCTCAVASQSDPSATALAKFQGTWELVSRKIDGQAVAADQIKGIRYLVKGANFTTTQDEKLIHHGTIKIIEAKGNLVKTDITWDSGVDKGKTIGALVEWLGDDSFRACRSVTGKERPADFSAAKGSNHQLSTLKKIKQ